MARHTRERAPAGRKPFHAPFARLGREVERVRAARQPPPPPPPAATEDADGEQLFLREMQGVRRLEAGARRRVERSRPPSTRRRTSEDAEALAVLADLVGGRAAFDITVTDEYVQGAVVGLDPQIVERLRHGEFARQAHLDLHGLTVEEARSKTRGFVAAAIQAGHRCVLLIHGRGLNSRDQRPVLKDRLKGWLARGALARSVLAFTTARPCDGGAGALYVLLRRPRRRKRPIRVVEGPG